MIGLEMIGLEMIGLEVIGLEMIEEEIIRLEMIASLKWSAPHQNSVLNRNWKFKRTIKVTRLVFFSEQTPTLYTNTDVQNLVKHNFGNQFSPSLIQVLFRGIINKIKNVQYQDKGTESCEKEQINTLPNHKIKKPKP